MDVDLVGGIRGVLWTNVCTYHKSMCPPTVWAEGGVGGTSRGLEGGCSWKVERLKLQGW